MIRGPAHGDVPRAPHNQNPALNLTHAIITNPIPFFFFHEPTFKSFFHKFPGKLKTKETRRAAAMPNKQMEKQHHL